MSKTQSEFKDLEDAKKHRVRKTAWRNSNRKGKATACTKCGNVIHAVGGEPIHTYLCVNCQADTNMNIWLNGGHQVSGEAEGLDSSESVMYDIWMYRKYWLGKG